VPAKKKEEKMLDLRIGRYRVRFVTETPPRFGAFPGSAWRGALGHALKRTVCVTRERLCRACALYGSCLYPYFYDTPPPPGAAKMRRYETTPHPFVLEPGEAGAESYVLDFVLIGQANRHLAVFLHALRQAAAGPRGVSGNRLTLATLEQEHPPGSGGWQVIFRDGGTLTPLPASTPAIPPVPARCTIGILTPLRVKRNGHHVGPTDFRFADLFGALLRRISMLTAFHTDRPLEADFRALMEAARNIPAVCRLTWQDLPRYSHRQHAAMKLGGVVGRIELQDTDLSPFWPYLWLGCFVHAGSAATMGLGRYHIDTASLQAPPPQEITETMPGQEERPTP
jgi:hypothetical protein